MFMHLVHTFLLQVSNFLFSFFFFFWRKHALLTLLSKTVLHVWSTGLEYFLQVVEFHCWVMVFEKLWIFPWSDIMINYRLSQKFKLLGHVEFNRLTIILTVFDIGKTCIVKLNMWSKMFETWMCVHLVVGTTFLLQVPQFHCIFTVVY